MGPPPLPPSLPPQSVLPFMTTSKQIQIKTELNKIKQEDLDSAIERLLSFDEKLSGVFYLSNTFLLPQLQDGPKCGLVALSIASSIIEDYIDVDIIFEKALSQGLTKQGEIFHANSLAFLAESCCGFKARVIEGGLNFHLPCIIQSLARKDLILIPYDADHNHSPCCKKGFKAHWAVITGFVIFETGNQNESTKINENPNHGILIDSLKHPGCDCLENVCDSDLIFKKLQNKILIEKKCEGVGKKDLGTIYVIGLQGKSRHLGLWSFDEMAKSNDNLVCFSSERVFEDYLVPEGGLEVGLKGKAVILQRHT